MSAYATALLESQKDFVVCECLRQYQRAEALDKRLEEIRYLLIRENGDLVYPVDTAALRRAVMGGDDA